MSRDVLLVGLGDETFKGQILHLCSLILVSGECFKQLWIYTKYHHAVSPLQTLSLWLVSGTGYLYIPAVLPIMKEAVNSYVPEDNNQVEENPEDPTTVILAVVANIFQKVIELLAHRLRKEPEEGKLVH